MFGNLQSQSCLLRDHTAADHLRSHFFLSPALPLSSEASEGRGFCCSWSACSRAEGSGGGPLLAAVAVSVGSAEANPHFPPGGGGLMSLADRKIVPSRPVAKDTHDFLRSATRFSIVALCNVINDLIDV